MKMDMGGLPHHLVHHTLGGVLAKQETLEGEQLWDEKTPWDYVNEEENLGLLLSQERK